MSCLLFFHVIIKIRTMDKVRNPSNSVHSNYNWRIVQVMKLLIMQLYPTSFHFIPSRSKYSPQLSVLFPSTPSLWSFFNVWETKIHAFYLRIWYQHTSETAAVITQLICMRACLLQNRTKHRFASRSEQTASWIEVILKLTWHFLPYITRWKLPLPGGDRNWEWRVLSSGI
jgi:hypothetical protein